MLHCRFYTTFVRVVLCISTALVFDYFFLFRFFFVFARYTTYLIGFSVVSLLFRVLIARRSSWRPASGSKNTPWTRHSASETVALTLFTALPVVVFFYGALNIFRRFDCCHCCFCFGAVFLFVCLFLLLHSSLLFATVSVSFLFRKNRNVWGREDPTSADNCILMSFLSGGRGLFLFLSTWIDWLFWPHAL